jgi:hypothetical protein
MGIWLFLCVFCFGCYVCLVVDGFVVVEMYRIIVSQ